MSSNDASVNVDPLNPVTLSNKTISPSSNPWSPVHVTVTVGVEASLEKLAPVKVVLIGWIS